MTQSPKREAVEMGMDLRARLDPRMLSTDIFLFGEVEPRKVSEIIQHLLTLDTRTDDFMINMLICSPGGECDAGYALIDVMLSMRHQVRTIALGNAASMAALIFISGTMGQRFMGSRAMLMFHPLSDCMMGTKPYLKDRMVSLDISDKFAEQLMAERTGLGKAQLEKAANGEVWLDSGEAVKAKVADGIISDAALVAKLYAKVEAKAKKAKGKK